MFVLYTYENTFDGQLEGLIDVAYFCCQACLRDALREAGIPTWGQSVYSGEYVTEAGGYSWGYSPGTSVSEAGTDQCATCEGSL